MRIFTISIAAVLLAACASETAPPEPAPAPTLSDEAFNSLWDTAYNANPQKGSDPAFAALLARTDLTDAQRGRAHYGRGTIRGIFVRDWPEAYPQCALGDLLEAIKYPMTDAQKKQTSENIVYQYNRRVYFPNAPQACMVNVEPAAFVAENDPCFGRRNANGECR